MSLSVVVGLGRRFIIRNKNVLAFPEIMSLFWRGLCHICWLGCEDYPLRLSMTNDEDGRVAAHSLGLLSCYCYMRAFKHAT